MVFVRLDRWGDGAVSDPESDLGHSPERTGSRTPDALRSSGRQWWLHGSSAPAGCQLLWLQAQGRLQATGSCSGRRSDGVQGDGHSLQRHDEQAFPGSVFSTPVVGGPGRVVRRGLQGLLWDSVPAVVFHTERCCRTPREREWRCVCRVDCNERRLRGGSVRTSWRPRPNGVYRIPRDSGHSRRARTTGRSRTARSPGRPRRARGRVHRRRSDWPEGVARRSGGAGSGRSCGRNGSHWSKRGGREGWPDRTHWTEGRARTPGRDGSVGRGGFDGGSGRARISRDPRPDRTGSESPEYSDRRSSSVVREPTGNWESLGL